MANLKVNWQGMLNVGQFEMIGTPNVPTRTTHISYIACLELFLSINPDNCILDIKKKVRLILLYQLKKGLKPEILNEAILHPLIILVSLFQSPIPMVFPFYVVNRVSFLGLYSLIGPNGYS